MLATAGIISFTSCEKDDATGASTISVKDVNVSVDTSSFPTATIEETDAEYTIGITLDQAQVVDVHVKVLNIGGTASEGSDFDFDGEIIIPAYSTSGSGTVTVYNDIFAEETESFTLQIGDTQTANANLTPQTVTIEMTNFTSPNLELVFDWSGTTMVGFDERSFCSGVDLDVFGENADGESIGFAATAACPEVLTLSDLPDGVYTFSANLWYNDIRPQDTPMVEFPITTTYYQPGVVNPTDVMQQSGIINSESPDYYDDGAGAYEAFLQVTVSNGAYTVEAL